MDYIELKSGRKWPLNTAYEGDCLEFMRELPDKCIDLVLTDPPYGIGADSDKRANTRYGNAITKSKEYGKKEWDKKIPEKEIFKEIFRVSKNQIIFGGNYFSLPESSCWIVWDKVTGNNGYADCELAYTSFHSAVRKFTHQWKGMLQENMKNKEVRIHPTQKPLKLFKWCLEKYAPENAIVFDPFLGSFTTAVACHSHGLNWIGCEKDPDYFKAGLSRYETECLQNLMDFGEGA